MMRKKSVGMQPKNSHFKAAYTHFKPKREKGVGKLFTRFPAPLHPCVHVVPL